NQLVNIPAEIGQLTNLQYLYLDHNQLVNIPAEIGQLTNLRDLRLHNNHLTTLPIEIGQLTNLLMLLLLNNNLTTLPVGVTQLTNLQHLCLSHNQLLFLPEVISQLTNLQNLILSCNQLLSLPVEIGNLRNLQVLFLDNNPIENIHPRIQRIVNGQLKGQNIYNDQQSVHNSGVQESLNKSICFLLNTVKNPLSPDTLTTHIIENSYLTDKVKEQLIEYMKCQDVHTRLNVTFTEVLQVVYSYICNKEECKEELWKRMNEEMNDSDCKCFTGRITRLVNTLTGFDPNVSIQILPNEQISNVIIAVKERLDNKNNYSVEEHKRIAAEELLERGYEKEVISLWLDNIE
ncbi:MAG: leucine-rich repeat domain-containing protein, partial [Rhodocyclales bacterium]|nr:leucine-rich repeat domain-containing protein [Rhodocyclales bacterium]